VLLEPQSPAANRGTILATEVAFHLLLKCELKHGAADVAFLQLVGARLRRVGRKTEIAAVTAGAKLNPWRAVISWGCR
jgi:hypothetical protein